MVGIPFLKGHVMYLEARGFDLIVHQQDFADNTRMLFPKSVDRYFEACYFAHRFAELEPTVETVALANWISGAHVTAVSSIRDAARSDYRGRYEQLPFDDLPIAKEFFLSPSDPHPQQRDPVAANRVYGDLRNLRIHHGRPVVELRETILDQDLAVTSGAPRPRPRYYFAPLLAQDLRLLPKPRTSPDDATLFNDWASRRAAIAVMYQHLIVLHASLEETASMLSR
jgi:hypothetical protein